MKKIALLLILTAVITGCNDKTKSVINGQFFGSSSKNIILEEFAPTGAKFVDSTRTNADGEFKFTIDFSNNINPTFYTVRMDDQFVLLLIEAGEKIELSSVGNLSVNYTVSGSSGSERLKEFNSQTIAQTVKLDSLNQLYAKATTPEQGAQIGQEYYKQYVKLKQSTIRFVIINATSLVAMAPLYQPIYDGSIIFDQPTDIVYFRAVADSLEKRYPTSPMVISLRNDIKRVENVQIMDSILMQGIQNKADFPEIAMKDAAGNMQKLSSFKGKDILLTFTASYDSGLKMMNRELLEVYEEYHPKGLDIFEVSIDTDKVKWINAVIDNKLPWTQVCDFNGTSSPTLAIYGITSIPSYFLINKAGVITGVKIQHKDIKKEVAKLFK